MNPQKQSQKTHINTRGTTGAASTALDGASMSSHGRNGAATTTAGAYCIGRRNN